MKPNSGSSDVSGHFSASGLAMLMDSPQLHLVEPGELQALKETLSRGAIPVEFEAKLKRLGREGLTHYYIEQTSRLFIAIWFATRSGEFLKCDPSHLDLMLKVLAYVAKENDFIPDYQSNGFTDDYEMIRATGRQLETLIRDFKEWRLKNQVPRFWLKGQEEQSGGLLVNSR